MKDDDILTKAAKEEIKAKLERAKASLDELEATAKERKAQGVTDAIIALRIKRDEIRTRVQEFKDANEARVLEIRSEIEAKLAAFEEELSKLAAKLKSKTASTTK